MKTTLLFILTLAGLSAGSARILKEYVYVNMPKTWVEAQSYCREMFNDLATVTNRDFNNKLMSVIQGHGRFVWIGLHDERTKWEWSLNNRVFNTKTDFNSWKLDEPNNWKLRKQCTVITKNGYWLDISCMERLPAVCLKEQGPSSYTAVKIRMTWAQARHYCKTKHIDLATVRSLSMNTKISSMLEMKHWIGLHRKSWAYWSDSRPTNFTNWHTGRPDSDGSCAAVNATTGTWWNDNCRATHSFICQKLSQVPDSFSIHHKVKFQSAADLKDPALQQQILEQLHAKLVKHGLTAFKLHWTHTGTPARESNKEEGSGA
ncbi:macrophage mannose receptor 1-like isoform X1 [Seriola lalandi dorsalis]|uniref:macrophage mannose receptor 1-like isoform X1 n=2 Tax=Seriola lalandi dorsalis TaxID=1841481 RepID=UPI000C6FC030|nr:macrophage mannose receptor 1-like isoform X1 [Seriola lalandi dorsalis]